MVPWDQAWAMLGRPPQPLGTTHGECQATYDRGVSAPGHVRGEREGSPDRQHGLDHVVVLMFENRSVDHLLGRLYQPGEVESFEGVLGKDLSNPIPEWAEHGAERGVVDYGVAKNINTPYPDPGEEYPHINTQLFGHIDPLRNRGVPAEQMVAPYNSLAEPSQLPLMMAS
jgi:phospholipase C